VADTVALPAIEQAFRTDPGRDPEKQTNEDACGYRQTRFGHLAVVCDGMGGHLYGKEASEAAIAAIFETFDHADANATAKETLRQAIERANDRVWALAPAEARDARPGSTVVALLLHSDGTEIAHVGDSRCYLVHAGQVQQMTRDHSIVEQLVARGVISREQAKSHPDANRITRALGSASTVEVELESTHAHVTGDTFVLCSDGLSDLVEESDILSLASEPPVQAAGRLVDLANARGGHDNITVMIIRARESAVVQGGVAPTVVQTTVTSAMPAAPIPVTQAPKSSSRRSKLPMLIGLTLAALGVGAGILALAAGLKPTTKHHALLDGTPFLHAPNPSVDAAAPVPIETSSAIEPPVDTDFPRLHHPDGSLRP
jgi:protein phosphatase